MKRQAAAASPPPHASPDRDTPPTQTRFAAPPARKRSRHYGGVSFASTPSPLAATAGAVNKQSQARSGSSSGSSSNSGSPSPPDASGNKRACKRDLRAHLRINETVYVPHVDQALLDKYNGGEPIAARFTGDRFFDLSQQRSYRSLSSWVKQRLVDVRSLSPSSNISGWDRAAVRRKGRKVALRMLIDDDGADDTIPQSVSSSSPPVDEAASPFVLAERMALLSNDSHKSEPEALLGLHKPVPAADEERQRHVAALQDAKQRASAYLHAIESRLAILQG